MAKKAKSYKEHEAGPKKRTSIGRSSRTRPKNKSSDVCSSDLIENKGRGDEWVEF